MVYNTHRDRNPLPIRFSSFYSVDYRRFRYNRQWRRAMNKIQPYKDHRSWPEQLLLSFSSDFSEVPTYWPSPWVHHPRNRCKSNRPNREVWWVQPTILTYIILNKFINDRFIYIIKFVGLVTCIKTTMQPSNMLAMAKWRRTLSAPAIVIFLFLKNKMY